MHHSFSSSTSFEMDGSGTDLDRIEAQRPTDVSHGQRNGTYISAGAPLLATNIPRSNDSFQNGGDGATPPTGDTESVPEYLTNLRLSDFFAFPGEDVQMTPEIFSGMSDGKKECLEKLRSQGMPMARLKSNTGDSILHLAATWGHLELVKEIVSECPRLLLEPNSRGKTPLHVAAHGGHTPVIEAFVKTVTFASARLCTEESERLNPYVLKDTNGNTALHYAIKGHYFEMATCLVNANQDAPFLGNNKGESSLLMAVYFGYVSLVKLILKTTGNEDLEEKKSKLDSKLQGKKYLAHAALMAKSKDVFDFILVEYPSLIDERDKDGKTCLSVGAYEGYYEEVCNLLDRSTKGVYVCDQDGSFPIHTAAENGHEKIVEEFIKRCPDSKYLLNKLGQNVLHIAAQNGKFWISDWLMNNKDTKHLGVGQDVDGNTPLHLAVMNWHFDSITHLANSSEILNLRNKSDLSAREIAESQVKPNYIFHERWTLALLLYAIHSSGLESVESLTIPSEPIDHKNNRDYVSTLLLVAALVATVTFAAGFTIPGGFNSDAEKPNLGRATLAKNPTLFIFLLFDILAMQSSVATICTLIWAQLGDPLLIRESLHVALPLLLFSLLCMPMAFLFGVITAIGYVKWLLVIISIISGLFFLWAIFILGPHVMLQRSHLSPKFAGKFLKTFMMSKDISEIFLLVIGYVFFRHF
ncbi:protein ACCELERATED CELL DEATH 6-like [Arabidopsis lyrata subsp. lyrata]|uniref:protein ACCELERATED CELL DEATH 6-like n=1 Tax=Arabidopsis lyrata subsp. lyrata TaxID=81972 RepID=UPI000A29BF06|nr:protein ACCELERATED CELL DEATH 6-like [Arabidopsis lyrata subsp. lyrata]|eukprot:XP_020875313.1 protein ACCELERATED CELL DEATH 6-like [Arabidopsis lyrata subsp. lyrata]